MTEVYADKEIFYIEITGEISGTSFALKATVAH
jgi:hypothetical protein